MSARGVVFSQWIITGVPFSQGVLINGYTGSKLSLIRIIVIWEWPKQNKDILGSIHKTNLQLILSIFFGGVIVGGNVF